MKSTSLAYLRALSLSLLRLIIEIIIRNWNRKSEDKEFYNRLESGKPQKPPPTLFKADLWSSKRLIVLAHWLCEEWHFTRDGKHDSWQNWAAEDSRGLTSLICCLSAVIDVSHILSYYRIFFTKFSFYSLSTLVLLVFNTY